MCKHEWVSIGTERKCIKCGADFNSAKLLEQKGINTKAKSSVAKNAKKQPKTKEQENVQA